MHDPKYPEVHTPVGHKLYRLRLDTNNNQDTIADDLDISHTTLSLIEHGRYGCLKLDTLIALARRYGARLGDVLPAQELNGGPNFTQTNNAENNQQHNHNGTLSSDDVKDKLIAFLEKENHRLEAENSRLQEQLIRSDIHEEPATITARPPAPSA